MRSLSSHLQHQAEQATDGAIPPATRNFIANVRQAERAMLRELGPVEAARQTLTYAWLEVADRGAEHRFLETTIHPGDGEGRARLAAARAELLRSLEWLEDCNGRLRNALRQADEDRRSA